MMQHLDSNTVTAAKRANEWLKIAANNIQSGLKVIQSHGLPGEGVGKVQEDLLAIIRQADEAIHQNKEVAHAGTHKNGRAVSAT